MLYRTIILNTNLSITTPVLACDPEDLNHLLHDHLGGFFEIVRPVGLPKGMLMLVDDEGILKHLPNNPVASALYGGYIAGKAIIMREGLVNGEPDIVSLDPYDIEWLLPKLKRMWRRIREENEND